MKICSVDGCASKHQGLGFCRKHYKRFKTYGNPLLTKMEMHGMSYTLEYGVWANMKDRCHNPNNGSYDRYGGRGISVCEQWMNSFSIFYKDMGPKPFKTAQIDRIDNNGNYEPHNCRWVTPLSNSRNSSATKLTIEKAGLIRSEYKTGTTTEKELSIKYNVHIMTISDIVRNKQWVED